MGTDVMVLVYYGTPHPAHPSGETVARATYLSERRRRMVCALGRGSLSRIALRDPLTSHYEGPVSLYDRILGHPFVYNYIRPCVVGGIDMSPVYERLGADAGASVLDVGCGTGDALNSLRAFERYLGVDVDPIAIRHARERYGSRVEARFEHKRLE